MINPALRAIASLSLAALTLCLAPAPTRAQAPTAEADARARELYLRGDRLYAEGRYEEAVEAFRESYRLSGRPLLLFNLANAYERLARYEEALAALRDYAPHAPVEEEDQIRARIESLTRRAEAQRAAEAPADGAAGDGSSGGSTGAPEDVPPDAPARAGGDGGLIAAGAVLAATGGALVVGGAVFGALALDARDEAQAGCADAGGVTVCDASAEDALDRDATFALLADVGLFAGGAAAATGVVLLVLGLSAGGDGESASDAGGLAPVVGLGPGGGEVGLRGRF
jgi:hypothetical protein